MSLLESAKKKLDEAIEHEGKQGVKSALLSIVSSLGIGACLYLYGQSMAKAGRHLGRMDVLDYFRKGADELDSLNVDIDKN